MKATFKKKWLKNSACISSRQHLLINRLVCYAQQFLLPILHCSFSLHFALFLHILVSHSSLCSFVSKLDNDSFLHLLSPSFSTLNPFLASVYLFFSLSHHPSLLYQHFYLFGPFFTFQSLALSAFALKMYLQSSFTVCELFFPYINLPDYRISVQTVQSHTQTSIHQSLSQANSLDIQSSKRVVCKIQLLLANQMKSLL